MSTIDLASLAAEARYLLEHGSGFVKQREMIKRLLEAVESMPADFWEEGYKAAVKDAYSHTNTSNPYGAVTHVR